MLEDLIHLVSLSDNLYLLNRLKEIQDIIKEESNDMTLGEKLRRIL